MTVLAAADSGAPARMQGRARVRTELAAAPGGHVRSRVADLRSQAPLKLRPTAVPVAVEGSLADPDGLARVCVAAGAAGPVGGDEIGLDVEVGAGSTLVLTEASATLVLPGRDGARSSLRTRIRVQQGARLVWLPEPVIAARGCHHLNEITVSLAEDARLLMREELLLGRRGEPAGRIRQRVRVRRDGTPLHVQDLTLGGSGHGSSPAIVGDHRAVGSVLAVDPALDMDASVLLDGDGAVLPLAADHAVLAQALSGDSIGLRRQLDTALTMLTAPIDVPTPSQEER